MRKFLEWVFGKKRQQGGSPPSDPPSAYDLIILVMTCASGIAGLVYVFEKAF